MTTRHATGVLCASQKREQYEVDQLVQKLRVGELDSEALALARSKAYGVLLRAHARALCAAIR